MKSWIWEKLGAKAVDFLEAFSLTTKIIAGSGAIGELAGFGIRRLLVVTDPFFWKNGVAERVANASWPRKRSILRR